MQHLCNKFGAAFQRRRAVRVRTSAAYCLRSCGPSAAAANLTLVPISGPSLPARLRLAALHAVETAAGW